MRVSVVGTGYVGLVTGACLAEQGHAVTCVDMDAARVNAVTHGEAPILEDGLPELIRSGRASGRLSATCDLKGAIAAADVSMLCVGTPSTEGRINLQYLEAAVEQVGAALADADRYQVVVVKSTVVPGTTGGMVRQVLEHSSGRPLGDFGLCMNPEFLSQGSAVSDFMDPDRIVIGAADERAGAVLEELYAGFDCPKLRMGLVDAEMVKYAANAFQATLISFANQIATICEHTAGADESTVMNAVHLDRHLGLPGGARAPAVRFLRAGIGFGGSCFPKDLAALHHYARSVGAPTDVLDGVIRINAGRPDQILDLLESVLGSLHGRTVSVLGLTFKPGTDDLRESPGLMLLKRLAERGARARGHDPLAVVRRNAAEAVPAGGVLSDTVEAAIADADAAVIATAWPQYRELDWPRLLPSMRNPIVVDGRNLLQGVVLPRQATLIRVGAGIC